MPRVKNPLRDTCIKNICLDSKTVSEVDLRLFSEAEGRVPYGSWSKLVTSLLENWIEQQRGIQNG